MARKGIDAAVYRTAQAKVDGALAAGTQELGLAENGVSLETPGDRGDPAILARVDSYRSRIYA